MRSMLFLVLCLTGYVTSSVIPTSSGEKFLDFLQKNQKPIEIPPEIFKKIKADNLSPSFKIVVPQNLKRLPIYPHKIPISPNNVVDTLLEDINYVIIASGIDPYTFASLDFFGLTIAITVGGFDTIHRSGDADMTVADRYNYEFYSDVEVNNLSGEFKFTFKFFGITYDAGITVLCESLSGKVDFPVSINPANGATYIYIKTLDITNIGALSVTVDGLGPLNPFASIICNFFANFFKGIIPIFFDSVFKAIANDIAAQLFPPWQ